MLASSREALGVDGGVAGGLQKVGPEGDTVGQAPGGQGLEDLGEGVGDGVGGVVGVGGHSLGHPPCGLGVAAVQLVEGAHIAGCGPGRQVSVARNLPIPRPG